MKITDMKCTILGQHPIVRITTDEGISGYGQVEASKPYLRPHIQFYKEYILDEDPTNVARVMLKIRALGAFKPWGSAVSAIEMALWDIAGKAAGVPVYKLLGGKMRDRVRVYNGGVRFPMTGYDPQDYAENMEKMKAANEGFTIIKQSIGFHSPMVHGSTELLLWRTTDGLKTVEPWSGYRAWHEARDRVCGGDEGGVGRRSGARAGLRSRLDGP